MQSGAIEVPLALNKVSLDGLARSLPHDSVTTGSPHPGICPQRVNPVTGDAARTNLDSRRLSVDG